jgi:hypothetical protein
MRSKRACILISSLLVFVYAPIAHAQSIVLKKAFVEKYKNRATIDANFTVDHAHPHPNPPAADGDLHASGRAAEIGLPMVSEVMNAAQSTQTPVVSDLQSLQGHNQTTPITGVWRIWFEHPSQVPQVQFDPVPPAGNTNPDHCFEIHPIVRFNGKDVSGSLQNVVGFTPHDAATSFGSYEKLTATVTSTATAITISSKKAAYNYVEFFAELLGTPQSLDDGGAVSLANVTADSGGDVLVDNVRLIFVPGTPPTQLLKSTNHPAELHLIGIPRLSLNAISAWVAANGTTPATRKLPYEIIVVAVLK